MKISLAGALTSTGVGLADIGMEEVTKYALEKNLDVLPPGIMPHDIFRHSLEVSSLAMNRAGGGEPCKPSG